MTYRHITNLRTPLDQHDQALLHVTQDYKLGDPVEALPEETEIPPVPVHEMKANGIVGLYAPWEKVSAEDFLKFTGWDVNEEWWTSRTPLI